MEVQPLSKRHLAASALLSVVALAILGGCGHRVAVPRHPADIPGYHKAPPDLTGEDIVPLQGRRILIDPGHGGYFRGAVGDGGLTEAEVNLGVALYLQGLLQWAGAEVHLTRTTDRDFLSPADSSLSADLAARVAMCDSLRPDVFLSIHHNSTASRDPDINETQTYHPLGRDGADRDLALCVHRQLVRALEISPAKILPGGFHVLRHAPVPAVLGEPAMLSNPVIEGRLSLARSLELEASAYFLGLRDYFAGGTPRWVTGLPDTVQGGQTPPASWTFDAGAEGAPGLDPTTLAVHVDGQSVPHRLSADGQTVTINRRLLPTARTISVHGRNLAGRATASRRHVVVPFAGLFSPPQAIRDVTGRALYVFDVPSARAGARAHTSLGLPGTRSADTPLPVGRRQRGWILLNPAPERLDEMVLKFLDPEGAGASHPDSTPAEYPGSEPTVARLDPPLSWRMLHAPAEFWTDRDVPGGHWRLRTTAPHAEPLDGQWSDRHHHPDWPAIPVAEGQPLWLEADGALPLLLDAAGNPPTGEHTSPGPLHLTWQPLIPELVGRRVAIDARGGGTDEQGRGPLGTRGSDLNLSVARRLAALLRGAGCEVLLVRGDDLHTPAPAKVQRANQFGAQFYLALGRGIPEVRHHPGSRVGEPWATELAGALGALLPDTLAATPAYDYVLRHTACPAAVVMLESPAGVQPDTEDRLRSAAWQNAVARSLLQGLVEQLAPHTPWEQPAHLLTCLGSRAIDRTRLDYLRFDGNITWLSPAGQSPDQTVASWVAGDPGLPAAGAHHVLELHAGPHWQLWTLTRQPSGDWHGRVFLENR